MKRARPLTDAEILRPTAGGRRRVLDLHKRLSAANLKYAEFTHLAEHVGLAATPALDRAVSLYVRGRTGGSQCFVERVLRPTVKCALEFDRLFALDDAPRDRDAMRTPIELNQRHALLSRRQAYCVVSNAFLGTFPPRDEDSDECLPSIDYDEMLTAPEDQCDVEVVKLRLLFDYFSKAGALSHAASRANEIEVFRSLATPEAALSTARAVGTRIKPPVVHALGESIDDQHGMLRMDFANRWIGGGALSDGSVQEEITFAQCPELNALRWFHGPMQDEEAIVVRGYRQYATIRPGTYGYGLKCGGPLPRARCPGGALLAVDAIDYRYDASALQFTRPAIERELVKLIAAFSVPDLDPVKDVAGGNWGCGVFGGDLELKFLIQWLACALCGKTLHYFPFDKPNFAMCEPALRLLCREELLVTQIWEFLLQLANPGEDRGDSEDADDGSRNIFSELLLYLAAYQEV